MYFPVPESKFWQKNRLLWALEQVFAKQRQRAESKKRRAWQRQLQQAIAKEVLKYPWERYWRQVQKQEDIPGEIPEKIPASFSVTIQIVTDLWDEASKVALAQAMVRGFDKVFARSVFEEGIRAADPLVHGIPITLKEELQDVLKEAMLEGKDQWDFAKMIRQKWSSISKKRAEIVAITEWARATETMNYATMVAGDVPFKTWITVGDERVCPICIGNAEQGVIGVREAFQGGVLHAPQHPRCRCTVSGLMEEEI